MEAVRNAKGGSNQILIGKNVAVNIYLRNVRKNQALNI